MVKRPKQLGAATNLDDATFASAKPRAAVVSRIAHQACEDAPRMLDPGKQGWWSALEEDFHKQPEGFELATRDNIRVRATALFDIGLRTFAASTVGLTAGPTGFNPLALRRALGQREFYESRARSGDGADFFAEPPRNIPVRVRRARMPTYRPPDGVGVVEDLSFESPFEPVHPDERAPYLKHRRNAVAHARLWRHNDGPRPTIVTVHGFGADNFLINHIIFALPWFFESLGCDVMMFTLPFHGPRQTRLSPFSGHGFFAGGLGRINEAFAQAVFDFRIFMDWLENRREVEKIGVTGLSLGGLTTSLLAAAEPRLKFAIPNVPVVTLADLVLQWHPLSAAIKAGLRFSGKSVSDVRAMLSASSPLSYRPVIPQDRLMIVGGVGDRLAPPKHARLLWDHWDRPRLHWFPGSHILHLDQGAYLREIARFLSEIRFLEPR